MSSSLSLRIACFPQSFTELIRYRRTPATSPSGIPSARTPLLSLLWFSATSSLVGRCLRDSDRFGWASKYESWS